MIWRLRRDWFALFLACLFLAGCGSQIELFGSLDEREANEVLAVLMRAGIGAEKIPGKNNVSAIRVDQASVARAIELLDAAGLPRDRFASIGDLFKREGLISSPSEERVRYMYGITQELSRTLTNIDGVLNARVHVVLPNNDPGSAAQPASAAVMIRYAPGAAVVNIVPRIKELVVNSIEGLSYDRVSVVMVRASEDLQTVIAATRTEVPRAALPMALIYALVVGLGGAIFGGGIWGYVLWKRRAVRGGVAPLEAVAR
ncbi:type III secretion system inner membrane ring lipoprotein SctJ [Hyphomicrobium sp. MC1]|uniref:type III secretion system inner membrane ring lipoprotein SctJ n=1 Tax=Hyphomicrobium sp. (strain MC1) TaxID=717785 RepID=UPI000213F233|nr:type III secretion inner membrane ring lipoprotein SctJ [Hyphomicrobium sp. MC1]CCB66712.1 Type III secretion apparatus lipoprotein, YscJ/HrcJ family [Hyphomicrobium sp. MC1]